MKIVGQGTEDRETWAVNRESWTIGDAPGPGITVPRLFTDH